MVSKPSSSAKSDLEPGAEEAGVVPFLGNCTCSEPWKLCDAHQLRRSCGWGAFCQPFGDPRARGSHCVPGDAVADKPKKNATAARKVLHNCLRLVDQAEKRGLTLRKERAKLSPKDAARLRRNVKISFTNWAQT